MSNFVDWKGQKPRLPLCESPASPAYVSDEKIFGAWRSKAANPVQAIASSNRVCALCIARQADTQGSLRLHVALFGIKAGRGPSSAGHLQRCQGPRPQQGRLFVWEDGQLQLSPAVQAPRPTARCLDERKRQSSSRFCWENAYP